MLICIHLANPLLNRNDCSRMCHRIIRRPKTYKSVANSGGDMSISVQSDLFVRRNLLKIIDTEFCRYLFFIYYIDWNYIKPR